MPVMRVHLSEVCKRFDCLHSWIPFSATLNSTLSPLFSAVSVILSKPNMSLFYHKTCQNPFVVTKPYDSDFAIGQSYGK